MSVNKKSISSQALLEMNEIKNAIKEESKNTIKAMLSEAVKNALRESIDEEDDDKDQKPDAVIVVAAVAEHSCFPFSALKN